MRSAMRGPQAAAAASRSTWARLGLLVLVDLVRQVEGVDAFLAGIGKDADVMEQPLGDEIEELLELLVGFAGNPR